MGVEYDRFNEHVQAVYNGVDSHEDKEHIELGVVYPRVPTNVIIHFIQANKHEGYDLVCGQPTAKKADEDTLLLIPQKSVVETSISGPYWDHLKDGFEVFIGSQLSSFHKTNKSLFVHHDRPARVFVAVENKKTNQYHLFPRARNQNEIKQIAR